MNCYQKYGCNMQFGGDDQWSNMLGGTELIRRKLGKDASCYDDHPASQFGGQEDGQDGRRAQYGWIPNKTSPLRILPVLEKCR